MGIEIRQSYYTIGKCKLPRPKPRIIECRSFKHFKEEDFIAALQNVPWYTAYLYEDSDDIWEHWSKLYNDVLELHAPLQKKQIRWMTPEITREMSPWNRLFKQYKKNPTSHSWQSYRKQRSKVTSLKRKEMKAFCQTASTNIKNPGEFWRQMKPLLPNCKSTTSIHFILATGRKSSSCLSAELSLNNETRMRVSNHISDCILERPATGQVFLQETKISRYAFLLTK